jgi:hypothetical protein
MSQRTWPQQAIGNMCGGDEVIPFSSWKNEQIFPVIIYLFDSK